MDAGDDLLHVAVIKGGLESIRELNSPESSANGHLFQGASRGSLPQHLRGLEVKVSLERRQGGLARVGVDDSDLQVQSAETDMFQGHL